MKLVNRYVLFVIVALVVFAIGATLFTAGVGAQEEGWKILRADYGFKNQRSDVSDILKDLIERGGVNGRVAVTNQTMGGDPAVGRDKSLRIFARNRRNEEREFNYKEGGFVEAHMFTVRHDDRDDHPAYYGNRDRDDHPANNVDRDSFVDQRRATRHHDKAEQAENELPKQVATDQHKGLLDASVIDDSLLGKLRNLGDKKLKDVL